MVIPPLVESSCVRAFWAALLKMDKKDKIQFYISFEITVSSISCGFLGKYFDYIFTITISLVNTNAFIVNPYLKFILDLCQKE